MAGEMFVSLADLRRVLSLLLDEVEMQHEAVVDLGADYYWTIDPQEAFRFAGEVPEPTVGQLSDDIQSMRDVLAEAGRRVIVWHDLAHVTGILNRLAALDHPSRELQ